MTDVVPDAAKVDLMARVLVIGYGNPLRNDDGLGWCVAENMALSGYASDVKIITCHQLNPELADPISRAELVLFVDAAEPATTAAAPGSIIERDLESQCESPRCFSHDLTPSTLLACAAELFGSSPRGRMFSIVGADFGMGEHLSPAVEASVPELLRRIRACTQELVPM